MAAPFKICCYQCTAESLPVVQHSARTGYTEGNQGKQRTKRTRMMFLHTEDEELNDTGETEGADGDDENTALADDLLEEVSSSDESEDTAEVEGFGHVDSDVAGAGEAEESEETEDGESLEEDAEDVDYDSFDDRDEM